MSPLELRKLKDFFGTTDFSATIYKMIETIEHQRDVIEHLKGGVKNGWQPIEEVPRGKEFLLIGQYPHNNTRTDVYHSWLDKDSEGGFARWPHPFAPTHFMLIPNLPLQSMPDGVS